MDEVEVLSPHRVEERRAFVLIDLDLTVLKSYDFADELFDYIASMHRVPREALTVKPGEATDTIDLIETALGQEVDPEGLADALYDHLSAQNKHPEDFLQPDALPFLQHINDLQEILAMIITKGGNKTQRVKLAFLRHILKGFPVFILPPTIEKKGENVTEEFFHDGQYTVTIDGVEYHSDQLVLVEDKISELEGLRPVTNEVPEEKEKKIANYALGVWVVRKEMTDPQKAKQLALQAAGQDLVVTDTLAGASNAIDAMLERRHS